MSLARTRATPIGTSGSAESSATESGVRAEADHVAPLERQLGRGRGPLAVETISVSSVRFARCERVRPPVSA